MNNTVISKYLVAIVLSFFCTCCSTSLEKKDREFSTSLLESKENNTFLKEYTCKVDIRSDSLKITVNQVWLEKSCFYRANVFESVDSQNKTLLLNLSINNDYYLNSTNFLKKWIIATNDTNLAGQLRNLYGISFYRKEKLLDTMQLKVYQLDSTDNVNEGLRYIGSIILKAK